MVPSNALVTALLTDTYQITMTYAYWKTGKHEEDSVFELFFRKNPFKGEFTIFCGLDECLKHLHSFEFSDSDLKYLKETPQLAECEPEFFDYLKSLNTSSQLVVRALKEGTVAFPKIPLLILEGPLGLTQLLETTLLNLVNYPSLLATNAARMVLRASPKGAPCIEFGLRRAQGPDGGCSASKYSYVGGFVATSNVQAGKIFGVPIAGTHAHAFVQSFVSLEDVKEKLTIRVSSASGEEKLFVPLVLEYRQKLLARVSSSSTTNNGELAAFCAYACAFPQSCLCLIDTYDTLHSGIINFVAVALALDDFGYTPKGIRLDSGDLASLSLACRAYFDEIGKEFQRNFFDQLSIVVSNDINEAVLNNLQRTPHAITTYGIGTNLVTCQAQPALGCVYKLVEWKGQPRIKLSQDLIKVTLPGRKAAYRLYGKNGIPLADLLVKAHEPPPQAGVAMVCRNPFSKTGTQQQRLKVTPNTVLPLHSTVWNKGPVGEASAPPSLQSSRSFVKDQLESFADTGITDYKSEISYPVLISTVLYDYLMQLWEKEAPMKELS